MADYFEKVLMEAETNYYLETYRLTSENFVGMDGPPWEINKFTLKGGKQHGVELVEIDNGCMSVLIVPSRGMGILEACTDEVSLGWNSRVRQVVHPSFVDQTARGGLGWLSGFNEMMCRCGLAFHGAPGEDMVPSNTGAEKKVDLTLHGTIANSPASYLCVDVQLEPPYELSVTGRVYDTQMFGPSYRLTSTVSTTPGASEFRVDDMIENLNATPSEMELLYHCNFGPPLLGEGARVLAPVKFACPRDARAKEGMDQWETYGPPDVDFTEQVYFLRLHGDANDRTVVALVDPQEQMAASIRFSTTELPAFTIWKNTMAEADGYVTGLEPGTDYPNSRSFERDKGRVAQLPAGGSCNISLVFGVASGAEQVAALRDEISRLAEGKERRVSPEVDPEYCPA
ncbi:MAG: aldose 1-epimerase family protein [Planctomycetes bacterium]|nr:aldose 1-epimerase family protein [Planctomycetota bacterium]